MSKAKTTHTKNTAAARYERKLLRAALACPHCGQPCGIGQEGLVCLEGHGRIRPFGRLCEDFHLTRYLAAADAALPIAEAAGRLFRRTFPQQVIEPGGVEG